MNSDKPSYPPWAGGRSRSRGLDLHRLALEMKYARDAFYDAHDAKRSECKTDEDRARLKELYEKGKKHLFDFGAGELKHITQEIRELKFTSKTE